MHKKVPKAKQRNCRARAKQRIKTLKLKNFRKRVMDNRIAKTAKATRPKGQTIVGKASKQVPLVRMYKRVIKSGEKTNRFMKSFYTKGNLNQRQKRKLWRQAPHMRKRA